MARVMVEDLPVYKHLKAERESMIMGGIRVIVITKVIEPPPPPPPRPECTTRGVCFTRGPSTSLSPYPVYYGIRTSTNRTRRRNAFDPYIRGRLRRRRNWY